MVRRRFQFLPALLVSQLFTTHAGCVGVSGDVSPQGKDQSEVVLAVPLDRPFTFSTPRNELKAAGFIRGQVVSVRDGMTMTVLIDDRNETVRLLGVSAPELDQEPWGPASRDFLRALVEGRTVRLETDATVRDQSKRLLADVYAGDIFVNLELVRKGMAVVSTVPPNIAHEHEEEYRKAQDEARERGYGLWGRSPLIER
jgi:micrococcal nuclease